MAAQVAPVAAVVGVAAAAAAAAAVVTAAVVPEVVAGKERPRKQRRSARLHPWQSKGRLIRLMERARTL
jgi:hypothetical protein